VYRLTGELAEWFGIDAGTLREGDRADFVVIDPAGLNESVDGYHEEEVFSTAACDAWSTATTRPWSPPASTAPSCSARANSATATA
jgi:cytosine/adenosine deaminase-related metal-dependent hydrolase